MGRIFTSCGAYFGAGKLFTSLFILILFIYLFIYFTYFFAGGGVGGGDIIGILRYLTSPHQRPTRTLIRDIMNTTFPSRVADS